MAVISGGTYCRRDSSRVATTWRQEWTAERAKTSKAITQPLAPQPTPTPITPAPAPGPARSWQEYLAQHPEQFSYRNAAPRAELVKPAPRAAVVKLPAPRAQLVRDLPPLIPVRRYLAAMPYNIEALATYKGQLASLDMFAIKRQPYRRHVGCRWNPLGMDLGARRSSGRLDRSVRSLPAAKVENRSSFIVTRHNVES